MLPPVPRAALSPTQPAILGSCPTARRCWLHGNMLSGSIPASLGRLGKLENQWLSENKLSDEILAALGLLSYYNLVRLRLASNQFTGCLPALLRDVADNDLDDLSGQDCEPGESQPPPVEPCIQTEETCSRRDVSRPDLLGLVIILFWLDPGNSVEKLLGSSTHIAFRGTMAPDSVRCELHGTAMTVQRREKYLRSWLGIDDDEPFPPPAEFEILSESLADFARGGLGCVDISS